MTIVPFFLFDLPLMVWQSFRHDQRNATLPALVNKKHSAM